MYNKNLTCVDGSVYYFLFIITIALITTKCIQRIPKRIPKSMIDHCQRDYFEFLIVYLYEITSLYTDLHMVVVITNIILTEADFTTSKKFIKL